MLRRRRPFLVREKSTKRGTCTVYSFSTYADYLRWANERYEATKVFDVNDRWHEKRE